MPTVAYQGHPGAFSDVAARTLVPDAETHGYPSFDAAAEALAAGTADFAVLPVENAIAGPVPRNYELLWEHPTLRICGEMTLPVEMCLVGVDGASEATIREVRSHPVALEQVRVLIDAHGWKRSTASDTAGAIREIVALGDPAIAAVGPALAAEIYGGVILARGVQDEVENSTRFFLLARDGGARFDKLSVTTGALSVATGALSVTTGAPGAAAAGTRACVGIAVDDRPGSLRDALSAFADRGIDLRFLIARPDRRVPFRYRFFVELAGVDDARLAGALAAIGGEQRLLGRY